MPRRPCLTCGKPSEGSHCPQHQPDDNARRNAKTVEHGVKRSHFQKLRPLVFDAAGGLCEIRLRGCTRVATTVHVDPALEGNHDIATLEDCQAACAHCHGVTDGARSSSSRRAVAV
jgi:hypothetical protein